MGKTIRHRWPVALGQRGERGATATEYGLLVGFIAIAIVLGVTVFGEAVNDWYDRLSVAVEGFL